MECVTWPFATLGSHKVSETAAVTITNFWDMQLPVVAASYRLFGGTCYLQLQGRSTLKIEAPHIWERLQTTTRPKSQNAVNFIPLWESWNLITRRGQTFAVFKALKLLRSSELLQLCMVPCTMRKIGRSRWPCGLGCGYATTELLASLVRITLRARLFVLCVCCKQCE